MPKTEIIALIAKSGIFAVLFVVLLFYLLKENNCRELRYQDTIDKLTIAVGNLDEIKVDIREIKKIVKVNYPVSLEKFTYHKGGCYER